jgi:uncharacterized protein (TIGR02118 family)
MVLYPPPIDPQVFEQRYRNEHIAIATAKIRGLTKFTVTQVLGVPEGPAPFHWIAEAYFDSMPDLQAALTDPAFGDVVANSLEISTGGQPMGLICNEETQVPL